MTRSHLQMIEDLLAAQIQDTIKQILEEINISTENVTQENLEEKRKEVWVKGYDIMLYRQQSDPAKTWVVLHTFPGHQIVHGYLLELHLFQQRITRHLRTKEQLKEELYL